MRIRNLLGQLPAALPQEVFEELLRAGGARLERIVSNGQASPSGHWSDQEEHEWLILLAGGAGLRVDGEEDVLVLRPGDSVNIPAHRRHRVEWTSAQEPTVWLALHYSDEV